jgi:hypothetical protein
MAADIADEEYLFKDRTVTKAEKERLDYKKKVYNLAREHERLGDKLKVCFFLRGGGDKPFFFFCYFNSSY